MKPRSKRFLIREALIGWVKEIAVFDHRIWDSLLHPLSPDLLPAVTVKLMHDRIIEEWSSWVGPGISVQMRECLFLIRVYSQVDEKTDSQHPENLIHQIMEIFNQKKFIGSLIKTLQLEIPDGITIEQGEYPVGSQALSCKVYYAETAI